MLTRISQVGTSVGVIIPRYIATEGGFSKGSPVNIEYSNNQIIISKPKTKREGWAEAFAKYAIEGEDEMLLPDHLDSEAIELM
ncbi:MAG: AbrB/MazE/SpoVT family DNA-binding domain-containing protein [Muribaculaceae bacterium]|nr:AbrB/MazE/SpoVT family DNA-binding domain-containing protein [Muribaculaceae bacterium]